MAVGLGLSAFFLWLTLRQVHFDEAWAALAGARWWYLAPGIATYALDLLVRAWRWSVLLRPVKAISTRRLLPVIVIGYMANMVLPARLGELVRAAELGRREGQASAALGSIATERVLDGLTTLAILLVTSQFLPRPDWLAAGLTTVAVVFVGALIGLALALIFRPRVTAVLNASLGRVGPERRWAGWAQQLLRWADHFLDGLGALREPRLWLRAVAIGLLAWTCSAFEYYWVFRAFDLPLGIGAAYFAVAAVGLSTAIPSAPGYVGTFEFAGVTVLTALGAEAGQAFSTVVLIHLMLILPVSVAGLLCAWRAGLSLGKLGKE
jgi:hypothetical protein